MDQEEIQRTRETLQVQQLLEENSIKQQETQTIQQEEEQKDNHNRKSQEIPEKIELPESSSRSLGQVDYTPITHRQLKKVEVKALMTPQQLEQMFLQRKQLLDVGKAKQEDVIKIEKDKNQDNNNNENTSKRFIQAIVLIKQFLKRRRERKIFLKKQKKLKHRGCVYDELVKTEKDYVESLGLVVKNIITPARQFMSEQQINLNFSNLEMIQKGNKQFLDHLKPWDPDGEMFKELIQFCHIFKIYSGYLSVYEQTLKNIEKTTQENPQFKTLKTQALKSKEFRGLDLGSYLIKPIQRLPKYVLLLKDLLKNTEPDHKDYKNLQQTLKNIEEVNEHNNQYIQRFVTNQKLFDLTKVLGSTKEFQLIDPKRKYLTEDNVNYFKKLHEKKISAIAYYMNDLIILTQKEPVSKLYDIFGYKEEEKYLTYIQLNSNSKIYQVLTTTKNEEQNVLYTISGINQTIMFKADFEQYRKILETMQRSIDELKNNLRKKKEAQKQRYYDIRIEISGIELKQDSVIYIVGVTIDDAVYSIKIKLQDLPRLKKMIEVSFPSLILPTFSYQNLAQKYLDPKLIQFKGVELQNYLVQFLTSHDFRKQHQSKAGQKIMAELGLPRRFYQVTTEVEMKQSVMENPENHIKMILTIRCPNITMKQEITEEDSASDIVKQVSAVLALSCYDDFKLLTIGDDPRIIQDDELIFNVFKEVSEEKSNLTKLKEYVLGSEHQLEFKKILYFSRDEENNKILQDPSRLGILSSQIINELKTNSFNLTLSEATQLLLNHLVILKILGTPAIINQAFMVQTLSTEYSTKQLKEIKYELRKSFDPFLKQIESGNNTIDQQIHTLRQNIYQVLSQNKFYGMNLYLGETTKNNKFLTKDIPTEIIIGIRFYTVTIMDRKKVQKLSIDYEFIEKVYSTGDVVHILKDDKKYYEFKCPKAFQVQQLCEEYKNRG